MKKIDDAILKDLLVCPNCRGEIEVCNENIVCLGCGIDFKIVDNIPILLPNVSKEDINLSKNKWEKLYSQQLELNRLESDFNEYKSKHLTPCWTTISKYKNLEKKICYLEIGCGPFYFGNNLAQINKNSFVVGIDLSFSALRIAKYLLDANKIKNYLLVCGDITKIPFQNDVFDVIYGGGCNRTF